MPISNEAGTTGGVTDKLVPQEHGRRVHRLIARQSPWRRMGKFWHQLGPGLTTGAADDDPSGIATYSQAGSKFGYQFLWLAPLTLPFMAVVQEMCARIGLVTGRGLAANIRLHFPRWVLYLCAVFLFVANVFNIGADLGAMAAAAQLLSPTLRYGLLLIAFALVSLALQIFVPYATYARYLKWLALVLLTYVITALTVQGIDWREVARNALLPTLSLSREQIILLCGILGTTISPYLFFWQTSQEVEEEILAGERTVVERQHSVNRSIIRKMRIDVWSGMFFSNLVMFFIILTTGAVLHRAGVTEIQSAAQAADALRPLAGSAAYLLFAIGVIGIGLLAIPVLAGSAAYALAESFHWKEGLYQKLKNAHAFYGIIVVSIVIGLLLNFFDFDPMRALVFAAVLNGIVSPLMLFFIVKLSSDTKLLGQYASGALTTTLGWFLMLVMSFIAVVVIALLFVPT